MKKFLIYVLLAGLGLTTLFSILGYFGQSYWFFDLFSHFKRQYLLILTVGIVILFFVKRKLIVFFLPFIFLLLAEIVPLYFGGNKNTALANTTKFVFINLLRSNNQFEAVENYLSRENPDVIVLQEFSTLWQLMLEPELSDYKYRLRLVREDNFGIAIYGKTSIENLKVLQIGKAGVPTIVGDFKLGNSSVRLFATHPLPPVGSARFEHRNSQLADLAKLVSQQKGEVVVIGDLNTSSFSTHFKQFISETGLIDSRKGFGQLTTWPTYLYLARTTLDHCLVSKGISVKSRGLGPNIGSDHLPIFVELGIEQKHRR